MCLQGLFAVGQETVKAGREIPDGRVSIQGRQIPTPCAKRHQIRLSECQQYRDVNQTPVKTFCCILSDCSLRSNPCLSRSPCCVFIEVLITAQIKRTTARWVVTRTKYRQPPSAALFLSFVSTFWSFPSTLRRIR